jgi:phage terminase large subunit-like protein
VSRVEAALAELGAGLRQIEGFDATTIDIDRLVQTLPEQQVRELVTPLMKAMEWERTHKFELLFPDEGQYRRELYPRHLEFFRVGKTWRQRCFMAANRVGKAQPLDEPVATPTGWRPIGDIRVGDLVLGSDGKPTRVTGVFPQGVRQIVRVTCSDGSWTRCDVDHLWHVRPTKKGKASDYITTTAADLARRIADGERWMLPARAELKFEGARELPIDPYLLGLLIGDGGLTTDRVLLSTKDPEIVNFCREQAALWGCELRDLDGTTYHFATTRKIGGRHHNALRAALIGVGLVGCNSHTKRVPAEYMVADAADRLALLQGLMDTDGTVSPANGARMYYSVNRALCEDVAALARSLGMNASVRHKKGKYAGADHDSWLTGIAVSEHSIFRVPRKVRNQRYAAIKMRGIMVETIEPDGEAPAVCIQVEAADHLYVTRDCIVTHNTVAGSYEVCAHLTGDYPNWWEGRVFRAPTDGWAAGDTNETTRDIIQKELLGEIDYSSGKKRFDGTGIIPKEKIGRITWKQGVQDLVDTVLIKHRTGKWSRLGLKSYDQGRRVFQGTAKHFIWLDEECPLAVYEECLVRTATTGGIIILTFTPLLGLSETVMQFMPSDMRPGG